MVDEIRVVKMERGDLPQIYEMYRDLIPEGCPLPVIEKNFELSEGREDYYLLVAKRGEEVLGSSIGIVCLALDAPFLVVENVIVKKDCRGRGVGRRIFGRLDEIAGENNCEYAILVSSGFRSGAHKFYEAMGYVDDVRGFRKYY